MRIKQVTQAYRKVILEQEFQDQPIDLSDNRVAVDHYEQKLHALSLEAGLLEKEIEKLDRRNLIKIVNGAPGSGNNSEISYKIFIDDVNQPDHIAVMNTPMNKHPEIKQRVEKLATKLNQIHEMQVALIEKLSDLNLVPWYLKEGNWQFTELTAAPKAKFQF